MELVISLIHRVNLFMIILLVFFYIFYEFLDNTFTIMKIS